MPHFRNFCHALLGLAALGASLPVQLPAAEVCQSRGCPASRVQAEGIRDVELSAGGCLRGRLVDTAGNPLAAEVVAVQGSGSAHETVTDADGVFAATGLAGGIYRISAGGTAGIFRLWAEHTAPPAARGGALLIAGQHAEETAGLAWRTGPDLIILGAIGGAVAAKALVAGVDRRGS